MEKMYANLAQEGKKYIILAEEIPIHDDMVKQKLFLPTPHRLENGNYLIVPDQWKEDDTIACIHVLSFKTPQSYSIYRACVPITCPLRWALMLVAAWGDNIGQYAAEQLVSPNLREGWRYRE